MSAFAGVHTYQGSCHCGAVRFEVDVDLSLGTGQCNCSICWKRGNWSVIVKPDAFRLLAGEQSLRGLRPKTEGTTQQCVVCGLQPFGRGDLPPLGGPYCSVNVRCLDGVDLSGVPVRYVDGRHDTWALLKTAPYLNPFEGAGQPGLKPAWEA